MSGRAPSMSARQHRSVARSRTAQPGLADAGVLAEASVPNRQRVTVPPLPALIVGAVHHTRHRPKLHRFSNKHYQWLIDLDAPPRLSGMLRAFSDLRPEDHLSGPSTLAALKVEAIATVRAAGIDTEQVDRVILLAHARVLGHVFDPMSVFWCLTATSEVVAAVIEVHNTYSGRHAYVVVPAADGTASVDKDFYVSPFNDTSGSYAVRLAMSAQRVTAMVQLVRDEAPVLTATVTGAPIPATPANLRRMIRRTPLMTHRVSALIRMHGIYLWLRRLPVQSRTAEPAAKIRGGALAVAGYAMGAPGVGGSTVDGSATLEHGPTGGVPAPADRPTVAQRVTALTRGRVARPIVRRVLDQVPVRLRLPDGSMIGAGRPDDPTLEALDPAAVYRRLEEHPKIGLGEAYQAGEWRAAYGTDLADALAPFAAKLADLLPRPLIAVRGLVDRAIPHHQRNTAEGSRANISAHYDLSNDLFAEFLDETMTYSSALFDESRPWDAQDLAQAQHRKIDAALDAAGVTDGTRPREVWKQQQPNLELRKWFQRQDELGDCFCRRLALQKHRSIEPPLLATHPRIRADRQVFDELAQVAIVATPRRLRLGIILGGDGQRLTARWLFRLVHGPPGYSQERVIGGSFSPAVTLTLIDSRLPLMSLTRRIVCGPGLIAKSRSGVCWIFLPSM